MQPAPDFRELFRLRFRRARRLDVRSQPAHQARWLHPRTRLARESTQRRIYIRNRVRHFLMLKNDSRAAIVTASEYLHEGVFEMASAYAFHIAENQPFLDWELGSAAAN